MWNSFDINVMVSGNRCKQYDFQGRKYIEAKNGSEWYFQIQNNTPSRILAVCSVDGLNVLTGEKAKPDDSGYIIDSYHSQKIKGFRFSDDAWALFKFGYKLNGKTYAQSKGDGSERNCGVIGVRLFYEKPKVIKYEPYNWDHTRHPCSGSSGHWSSYDVTGCFINNISWAPNGNQSSILGGLYGSGRFGYTPDSLDSPDLPRSDEYYCDSSARITNKNSRQYPPMKFQKLAGVKKKSPNFDIGTEWGKRETSKVQTVDFERGCEAYSTDIFYASRNSLIDMGIPLGNELKVRFPESFPNRYAKPPKGWSGV